MAFNTLLALAIAATALAKETCTTEAAPSATSPTTLASNFRLVANVSFSDLDSAVQPWEVSSYHIGPCYDYAVLLPEGSAASDSSPAFYVNGTDNEVRKHTSDVLTDGGTPIVPYGIIVPQAEDADSEGRRAVQINCGEGTDGVYVSHRGDKPHLSYLNKEVKEAYGGWYGCNETLPYGPAVLLFYRNKEEVTPKGCMDLKLYVECIKDVSAVSGNAKPAPCEADVAPK